MSGIVNSVGARSGIIGSTEIPGGYEEGKWTPASQGAAVVNPGYDTGAWGTFGEYVRIGNCVFIKGRMKLSSADSTASNSLTIEGLPFTQSLDDPSNTGEISYMTMLLKNSASVPSGHACLIGQVNTNTDRLAVVSQLSSAGAGTIAFSGTNFGSTGNCAFSGHYYIHSN